MKQRKKLHISLIWLAVFIILVMGTVAMSKYEEGQKMKMGHDSKVICVPTPLLERERINDD